MKYTFYVYCVLIFLASSCNTTETKLVKHTTLFSLIPPSQSTISFNNTIKESLQFNFINYPYIYNGGGVAVGDINNDGFIDIYFSSNQQSNALYLNKGNFKFQNITNSANVKDDNGWTTGVSMIDINNDGFLDIYVCKSGELQHPTKRKNKLFINQGDNTFIESAEKWNLADEGFSTQAYFFDYDKDGDLDMYLVNHRPDFNNNSIISLELQAKINNESSDQLYENQGNSFKNVSFSAGIMNKAWGLSASIGDFNNDSWPDIYVCNDFLEPDMLYINKQNGTFNDEILAYTNHISANSMGSDFSDINNDLYPDLVVLEMTPEDHVRSKENMPSMSTENFTHIVNSGYHYQYMANTLQLNNKNGTFSEIGQLAGISKTDWSWAPLITDFDNDGLKDVFITNGISKDLSNQDFRNSFKNKILKKEKMSLDEAINMLPSSKIKNYSFRNTGNLKFENTIETWGFSQPTYSNGCATADLDNDGALDLIINNSKDIASIYRNNSKNNYIKIKLKGSKINPLAIGSKIEVFTDSLQQSQELYLSRGFQSSISSELNFGLNQESNVKKVKVIWPSGEISNYENLKANKTYTFYLSDAKIEQNTTQFNPLLKKVGRKTLGINFKHQENSFDDFKNQILLPYSQSKNGPFISSADVNNDGNEDFFIGGAKGQSGALYLQNNEGTFNKVNGPWELDYRQEDLGSLFFDCDNDHDLDLYVVSGGSEFPANDKYYKDRLYINNGKGNFIKSKNSLPKIVTSGQIVKASDIDNDGDLDLFIGGRIIPDKYPFAPNSYFLINENGVFKEKTNIHAPEIKNIGMISDVEFSDYDNDGDEDLIIVGEWMPITIFENENGIFSKINVESLSDTAGIWFSISSEDLDNDGDQDYIIGNLGLNSKFKASKNKSFHIFCDDFDKNGTFDIVLSGIYKGELVPMRGLECSSQQMPFIKEKYPNFKSFANAGITDILGNQKLNNALHYEAKLLSSVYLENLGDKNFKIVKLPIEAQISPIMDIKFFDINNNGSKEIFTIGNHYNTEVETIRFDASFGTVMSFKNKKFSVLSNLYTGFSSKGNAKSLAIIKGTKKNYLLVSNNNDSINIFSSN
ncbi:MAG: VCBS repeat-containing protein [Lutibacter sp.]|uniref:VCBS repeat-containing protein n=1 Tax=Lutibacter sp. TaxID=1925666 RepID=UPI00385B4FED